MEIRNIFLYIPFFLLLFCFSTEESRMYDIAYDSILVDGILDKMHNEFSSRFCVGWIIYKKIWHIKDSMLIEFIDFDLLMDFPEESYIINIIQTGIGVKMSLQEFLFRKIFKRNKILFPPLFSGYKKKKI